ncbi:MAG TPA: phosphoenolpyruvate synthase [Puia sp.]|nr:phosphoenolpyruvate synthase [Puia sp.]
MSSYAIDVRDLDKAKQDIAGGKGANIGELFKINGLHIPGGFCISTAAYKQIIEGTPIVRQRLDELSILDAGDRDKIISLGKEIRSNIEEAIVPMEILDEIIRALAHFGENKSFAIRSSATGEDLPTASFAGQQDTYLNVIGKKQILSHIKKCWASLYTERAIRYRLQNGVEHRKVQLSVLVQIMVSPSSAGILFTADPISASRKVVSIDASFGLGEAIVSGLVNADVYKIRNNAITEKKISRKSIGIYLLEEGGTVSQEIEPKFQNVQVLTDDEILTLVNLGRKIEEHFGSPQDIEWCLADNTFYILQSRPITTLFPIPKTGDHRNHVYVSVGHQQMMTDPMKPLGLSIFQLTAARPMFEAAGRLFVDVVDDLASADRSGIVLNALGQSDPLIKDALMAVIDRDDFIKEIPKDQKSPNSNKHSRAISSAIVQPEVENDPSIVFELIKNTEKSIAELKLNILAKAGPELFDFIQEDIQQLKKMFFESKNLAVIMAAINASNWINQSMNEWLGEKNAADQLSQSVPNNITSEMGLALLDVADVIRPHPLIIDYLNRSKDEDFLDVLPSFAGGIDVRNAIISFLEKYGMRCVGEIDITKTRWSEKPIMLVPMILSNIKNFKSDASHRKFEQGRQVALEKEKEILNRLKQLPGGEEKSSQAKQHISVIRNFLGYREYPKYGIVSRYFIYKQALLKESEKLFQTHVINDREDVYYLRFEEFRQVVLSGKLDYEIVTERKDSYKLYGKLSPPRVITSDGEVFAGRYNREKIPSDAFVGLPVSSGTAEGRARVILRMEDADLGIDDILITSFTDPSWTPLFVSIKGLVTEVGGLMTHGAVIAREYGLPAVVGVENVTKLIKDGQQIRVHGTEGYVEILQ